MAHTELNVRERRRIEDMLNAVCNASLCRYYKVIPMEKAMPTPVAVKLDEDIHSRVKVLAEARDRSSHWMMREAIAQYVEREEKCEAFRQDGIRAWDAYQETGLHVTHAEADAWLAQLATGEDQDPSECPA